MFYRELLLEESTKNMLLGITDIIKNRKNAEKISAQKLLEKIGEMLNYLKYQKIEKFRMVHFNINEEVLNQANKENFEDLGTVAESTKVISMKSFIRMLKDF